MGTMSKESVFELLDYFHSQGGNFIDTSNNYQSEQSEVRTFWSLSLLSRIEIEWQDIFREHKELLLPGLVLQFRLLPR